MTFLHSVSPVIPGLVREVYEAGSRHTAGTPTLISSNVDKNTNEVDFTWKAVGSSIYSVTVKGSVVIKEWDDQGPKFDYSKLTVVCSCPDGSHQNATNESISDKLRVCKHAKSALDSACDPEATKSLEETKMVRIAEHKARQADHLEYLKTQRTEQEQKFPGESERIEHGLLKRSDAEIAKLVKEGTKTVSGLEALVELFPPSIMPAKKSIACGRCKKSHDPQVKSDLICREEHPCDRVRTEWDGSKKSWDHCHRCDKTFNLNGHHSWGKRRRDDPEEEGDYCYETTHVPCDEHDEISDPVMNNLDNSDY